MPNDAYCLRDGHRTYFKWHRGRRQASDPVFTGQRILEGLTLGASVEVDLVHHGSGGFAVLHDTTLGRESTGEGKVAETSAAVLRTLRIRDNDGRPSPHPVMLLEDLCALLARGGFSPEAGRSVDASEATWAARTLSSGRWLTERSSAARPSVYLRRLSNAIPSQ
jgi:hypothetical protein